MKAKTEENIKRKPIQRKVLASIPDELVKDYRLLGLDPGTSIEACKTAQKALLKKHHPDMHSADPVEYEKACNMSSSINMSYQRILHWVETGLLD